MLSNSTDQTARTASTDRGIEANRPVRARVEHAPGRRISVAGVGLLCAALLFVGSVAQAESARGLGGEAIRGYEQFTGAYGQFGISIGQTNGDDGLDDTEAQGGFNLNGGYRFNSWLAGEIAFIFMRGEIEKSKNDGTYYSFTFGPKIYPVALLDPNMLPQQFQPYTTIAIGGGKYEIENTKFDEGTFIARFIFGFDYWLTDNIGAFMEGGYHVASEDDIAGTGVFTFGGQYRF